MDYRRCKKSEEFFKKILADLEPTYLRVYFDNYEAPVITIVSRHFSKTRYLDRVELLYSRVKSHIVGVPIIQAYLPAEKPAKYL